MALVAVTKNMDADQIKGMLSDLSEKLKESTGYFCPTFKETDETVWISLGPGLLKERQVLRSTNPNDEYIYYLDKNDSTVYCADEESINKASAIEEMVRQYAEEEKRCVEKASAAINEVVEGMNKTRLALALAHQENVSVGHIYLPDHKSAVCNLKSEASSLLTYCELSPWSDDDRSTC